MPIRRRFLLSALCLAYGACTTAGPGQDRAGSAPDRLAVDFDGLPPQTVTAELIASAFGNCLFIDPDRDLGAAVQQRNQVVDGTMRIAFPAGLMDLPANGGSGLQFEVQVRPRPAYDYSLRLYFEPDFDFGRTPGSQEGKLTGLGGGTKPSGGTLPDGRGFTARFIWQDDDHGSVRLKLYVYHLSQRNRTPGEAWGDTIDLGVELVPGRWYALRMRLDIDPATGIGNATTFVDGRPTPEQPTLCNGRKWVNPGIGVDTLIMETFYGGGDAAYAPGRASALRIDDIVLDPPEAVAAPAAAGG